MRVVIGEDQALLREGIARLLEEAGFDVVGQAGDAVDLRRKVGAHKPDVAVVDIQMPPTRTDDGLRAAIHIRSAAPVHARARALPVRRGALRDRPDRRVRRGRRLPAQGPRRRPRRVRRGGAPRRRGRLRARPRGRHPHARPHPRGRPGGGAQPARARRARADGPGPLQPRDRREAVDHRERRREARHRDLREARPRARLRGPPARARRARRSSARHDEERDGTVARLEALLQEQAALRRVAMLVARDAPARASSRACARRSAASSASRPRTSSATRTTGRRRSSARGRWRARRCSRSPRCRSRSTARRSRRACSRSGRTVRVDDYGELDDELAQRLRAVGIRSAVGAPIVVAGPAVGRGDRRRRAGLPPPARRRAAASRPSPS